MANAPFNQSGSIVGLSSFVVSCPNAGPYNLDWKISLPTLVGGGGQSACIMTIVNGTGPVTVFTGTAGAEGGSTNTLCAAGDVLTFTLSSANAVDAVLNAVKATLAISQGVN